MNEKFWFGFLNRNDSKIKLNKAFDPIERALLTKINNKKSLFERGIMGAKNLENYYSDPVTIACFQKSDSETKNFDLKLKTTKDNSKITFVSKQARINYQNFIDKLYKLQQERSCSDRTDLMSQLKALDDLDNF